MCVCVCVPLSSQLEATRINAVSQTSLESDCLHLPPELYIAICLMLFYVSAFWVSWDASCTTYYKPILANYMRFAAQVFPKKRGKERRNWQFSCPIPLLPLSLSLLLSSSACLLHLLLVLSLSLSFPAHLKFSRLWNWQCAEDPKRKFDFEQQEGKKERRRNLSLTHTRQPQNCCRCQLKLDRPSSSSSSA